MVQKKKTDSTKYVLCNNEVPYKKLGLYAIGATTKPGLKHKVPTENAKDKLNKQPTIAEKDNTTLSNLQRSTPMLLWINVTSYDKHILS